MDSIEQIPEAGAGQRGRWYVQRDDGEAWIMDKGGFLTEQDARRYASGIAEHFGIQCRIGNALLDELNAEFDERGKR